MAVAIDDTAPDFEAETTEGKIRFHDWIGDCWAVLFSHPKDFTPVCTTELGYMARIKPEFDKRGVKIIGLSVDPVDNHASWASDIKETQGFAPNYPMIGDTDFNVSKLYGMLPADASGDAADRRTAADNQTVRNVFVIGPDKKIKLILVYPMTTGRNFDEVLRVIDSLQLTAKHKVATPVNWKTGRGRHHRRLGLRRRGQEASTRRAGRRRSPIIRIVPAAEVIVTASWDKTARLWDAATGKPIGQPLTGHTELVESAAFSPDVLRIVTSSDDKRRGRGTPPPANRSARGSGQRKMLALRGRQASRRSGFGARHRRNATTFAPVTRRRVQLNSYLENFLYFIRCGMIESVPSRRILSFS